MLKSFLQKHLSQKSQNNIAILKNFSSFHTEIIPRLDLVVVFFLYRFNFIRNRFLKHKARPFSEAVDVNSKVADFCFSQKELENFERDGITPVFNLKKSTVDTLIKNLNSHSVILGEKNVKISIAEIRKFSEKGQFDGLLPYSDLNRCNEIVDIGTDPAIVQFVSKYLRSDSFTMDVMAFWSFPNKSPIGNQSDGKYDNAQNFHYDHVSRRCVKIFVYLTDCGTENGPHVFIKKSHLHRPMSLQSKIWRLSDEEMQKYVDKDESWVTITGKTGSAFMTDPFGTHRGLEPKAGNRLLVQFMYSLDRFRLANFEVNLNASDILRESATKETMI
jgi:hypothetical protein